MPSLTAILQKKLQEQPKNENSADSLSEATLSPASKAEQSPWSAAQLVEKAAGKDLSPLPLLEFQARDAQSESSLSIASKTFSEMKNQETSAPVIKVPKS